jgi:hypothetical protein
VNRAAGRAAALIALALGAGCAGQGPSDVAPPAQPPPAGAAAGLAGLPPAAASVPAAPSPASAALAAHYARLQADLLSRGLLRGDGGGADTPFTDVMLARDFVRIALYDEYAPGTDLAGAGPVMSRLRRWEGPIRMDVQFGAAVPPEQQVRDRATIAAYAARLSRISGLPVTQTAAGANYHVFVVTEEDRRNLAGTLRRIAPGIAESTVRSIVNMPRSTLCLVAAFSEGEEAVYTRAIAVIRAEHPDLLRTACVHEELAQGLGLANDHPQARPSIFNDDEEFALLTGHDELLLRILYDPRLTAGMTPAEAAPIASRIAAELMGES